MPGHYDNIFVIMSITRHAAVARGEIGDIVATGTPPGVGMGRKPELISLRSSDVVSLGIERFGGQWQPIIDTAE